MKYDIVIVGGGIVGLATAFRTLQHDPSKKVLVLEKESGPAAHQTGHNSGVIHSGIYYKPGSLKALNCINGYRQLIEFCDTYGIPYDLCGKIIVATLDHELPQLDKLYQRGQENGLQGMKRLSAGELKEYEPHVAGMAGIFVPQTGIISYRQVSVKLASLIGEMGGEIRYNTRVTGLVEREGAQWVVTEHDTLETRLVVNCAGLYSDKVAAMGRGDVDVRVIPFRGEYYMLKDEKKKLVRNLIYPVPDPNFPFLGVHFTRMIDGKVEAGPNAVFAFKREAYNKTDFDWAEVTEALTWPGFQKVAMKYWQTGLGEYYRSFSKAAFTKALQRLIPEVQEDDLVPAGAGVRAQACDRTGGLLDDFMILEDTRCIHVCNAPSPAATSSLSIGKTISELIYKRLS